MGATCYADDLLLMAPTRSAMEAMIKVCERYAQDHNISFSTHDEPSKSKTKCMIFFKTMRPIEPLRLNQMILPSCLLPQKLST